MSTPGPNDLSTLAHANSWLGTAQGTDDDSVQRLITAFSTKIQKWLGYNIAQATYVRTFNGEGTRKLYLPDIPVTAVTSVVINSFVIPQGAFLANAQQAGWYFDAYSIALIGYVFHRGFQNITVSYQAGYAAVPSDLEQACLDWIKIAYFRKVSGIGPDVQQIKAGNTSITWGAGSLAVTDPDLIPIPTGIYVMLQDYQRKQQISGF